MRNLDYNDERAIKPLLRALKDEDSYIRRAAAIALGAFDNERVIQALTEISKADVPRVEENAKISLGRIMRRRWVENQSLTKD